MKKIKARWRIMLPLLLGVAAFFAPIEIKADDSCYSCGNYPTPSASISNSSYVSLSWGTFTSDCCAIYSPRYVVYRSTSSTFTWSSVTRLTTTYNRYYYDYSATAGTTYYYWIGVVDDDGAVWVDKSKKDWGKRTASSCFQTASLPTPSCSISYQNYVYISWSSFTGCSPFSGYVVYRSTSSSFSWSGVTKVATLGTSTTSYYDYSASVGVTYYYWIGVKDSSGATWVNYDKKDWGKRTGNCFQTATLPTPSCSISYQDYVYISWSSFTGCSPFSGYVVYRSTSSSFSWSGVTKVSTLGTGTTSYYDRSASRGVTYYYWIGVKDSSGSTWVNYDKKDWGKRPASCFQTATLPTPSCSISYQDYVYISWSSFTGCSPFSGYVVYRSTSPSFSWSGVTKVSTLGTGTTSYYDRSASPNVTYYYWIGVKDSSGATWVNYDKKDWGKRTGTCFETATLPTPSCSISYSSYVHISWSSFTGCSPFRAYVVYRSTSSTFSWTGVTKVATLSTGSTSYNDYSASYGTTYYYWIGVTDSSGATWVNYSKKDWGRRSY